MMNNKLGLRQRLLEKLLDVFAELPDAEEAKPEGASLEVMAVEGEQPEGDELDLSSEGETEMPEGELPEKLKNLKG